MVATLEPRFAKEAPQVASLALPPLLVARIATLWGARRTESARNSGDPPVRGALVQPKRGRVGATSTSPWSPRGAPRRRAVGADVHDYQGAAGNFIE
jgi:hypothetical protein